MRSSDSRIGTSLGAGLFLPPLSLALVAGFGALSIARMHGRVEQVGSHNEAQVALASTMSSGFREIMKKIAIIVQASDKQVRASHKATMAAARDRGAAKRAFTANIRDPKEQADIDGLDVALKVLIPHSNKAAPLAVQAASVFKLDAASQPAQVLSYLRARARPRRAEAPRRGRQKGLAPGCHRTNATRANQPRDSWRAARRRTDRSFD